MFCKNCGNKIKDGIKFCTNCGNITTNKKVGVSDGAVKIPALVFFEHFFKNIFAKLKQNQNIQKVVGITAIVIIIIIIVLSSKHNNNKATSNINLDNTKSVVNIWCDNDQGGSGTIFTTDGIILTNNHVIAGSTSCKITIPNVTGGIDKIYEAIPVIAVLPKLSEKYDVATLKINATYTDSNGKTWGTYPTTFSPFILPKTCNVNEPSKLGDSVRIYGYPVTSGGFNLTITDGTISSFTNEGDILTSAQIDNGNSGGLAVDQNGCWLGIPSAVVSGNYQNLGVIIPGDIVEIFLSSVPVKFNPSSNNTNSVSESAINPQETSDQQCQSSFGVNSEWTGKVNSKGSPECLCQNGYSWDATGDSCALQTSLQKECKNNYGSGSYSTTENGKAVCDCKTGYQLNKKNTACVFVSTPTSVSVPNNVYSSVPGCTSTVGYSPTTGLSCSGDGSCAGGSFKYEGMTTCMTPLAYCQSQNGPSATYDPADNSCGTSLVKTGYQVCSEKFPNTTWDGTYLSSGGYSCVCNAGYTLNTAGTACY